MNIETDYSLELFYDFNGFQLLFSALFRLFGLVWGAVWGISAVSATFFLLFFGFWLGLVCCFADFCGFSYFFQSSPNLCVNSSFSYVVLSTLLLSSRDLTEWSLVYHNTLSYQRFYDLHSIHYDHLEGLHQSVV